MEKVCISWIGTNDLNFISKEKSTVGPIIALLDSKYRKDFRDMHLLYNYTHQYHSKEHINKYIKHIKNTYNNIIFHKVDLNDPSDYKKIYSICIDILNEIYINEKEEVKWFFHTSPGTNQMATIWVIISKTQFPAKLFKSYYDRNEKKEYISYIDIPFDIDIEVIKPLLKEKKADYLVYPWKGIEEFENIIGSSEIMNKLKKTAYDFAQFNESILISGETGTGKELIAKAIHCVSKRKDKCFEKINCGAITSSLFESQVFGWSKGGFTGATDNGLGLLKACDGGTIFFDEIGELNIDMQVKLLRAVEYGEFQRVGDQKTIKTDVRYIFATNKYLIHEIKNNNFREDLYYRISTLIINIPNLNERKNDLIEISNNILDKLNKHYKNNIKAKKFKKDVEFYLKNHNWEGNVRELINIIKRAYIYNNSNIITKKDLIKATEQDIRKIKEKYLDNLKIDFSKNIDKIEVELDINTKIDIEDILKKIEIKYINKTLELTDNNKNQSALILGYKNYQTLIKRINDFKNINQNS